MKKLIILSIVFFAALVASCKETPKDYVTFSGKIINKSSDTLIIVSVSRENMLTKPIAINADGTFKDTLKLKGHTDFYLMPSQSTLIIGDLYLKNGFDLHTEINFAYNSTISFTGVGAVENNYLTEKKKLPRPKMNRPKKDITELEKNQDKLEFIVKRAEQEVAFLNTYKDKLDSSFYEQELSKIESQPNDFKARIQGEVDFEKTMASLKGKPSPSFTFENYKGGTTSLEDFKGKYVYIDVWATWCSACLAELPALKKREKEYHNKNIVFVSISTNAEKEYEKWRKMIVDRNMDGIQLIDFEGKAEFFEFYKMRTIPRFILIDPSGTIVSADAPRPSDPELKELLNSLPL